MQPSALSAAWLGIGKPGQDRARISKRIEQAESKQALQAAFKQEAAAKKKAQQLAEVFGDSHPTVLEAMEAQEQATAAKETVARTMREALPKEEQHKRAEDAALHHETEKVRQEKHFDDLRARMASLKEQVEATTARSEVAAHKQEEPQREATRLQTEVAQEAIKKATEALQTKPPSTLPPSGRGAGLANSGEKSACLLLLQDVQN
jgi:hypothetical protein